MKPRPFEEWIEKGHQRDANLCSAYARPTDERSLVRADGGYNQRYFVYFDKGCGGWVFAGVNGVVCVNVEGRAVLSDGWDKPRCARWQAIYNQNRDDYEVQGCVRGGGGSEMWLHARVLCVHIVRRQHTCNGSTHAPTHVPACIHPK